MLDIVRTESRCTKSVVLVCVILRTEYLEIWKLRKKAFIFIYLPRNNVFSNGPDAIFWRLSLPIHPL